MGDWGFKPWENDEGASWFWRFMKSVPIDIIEQSVETFNISDEMQYDDFRAVCYVIACFCKPHIWPVDRPVEPQDLMDKAINFLTEMIDTKNEKSTFLDMWADDPGIIQSVHELIDQIKDSRSEWAELKR